MEPEEIELDTLPRSELITLVKNLQEQISDDEEHLRHYKQTIADKIARLEHEIHLLKEVVGEYELRAEVAKEASHFTDLKVPLARVYPSSSLLTVPFQQ